MNNLEYIEQGEEKIVYLSFTDAQGEPLAFEDMIEVEVLLKVNGIKVGHFKKTSSAGVETIYPDADAPGGAKLLIKKSMSKSFPQGDLIMEVATTTTDASSPTEQLTDVMIVPIFTVNPTVYKTVV